MEGIQPSALDPMLMSLQSRNQAMEGAQKAQLERAVREEKVDTLLDQFQNILWGQMVKSMREAVPKTNLFGENIGEEIFQGFLDEEYAKQVGGQAGALGLTEVLKQQLGLERPVPAAQEEPTLSVEAGQEASAADVEKGAG